MDPKKYIRVYKFARGGLLSSAPSLTSAKQDLRFWPWNFTLEPKVKFHYKEKWRPNYEACLERAIQGWGFDQVVGGPFVNEQNL